MSRRLVAWAVAGPAYGRAFLDPRLADPDKDIRDEGASLLDALMVPKRLKREQAAAGIETVRRAGREAWDIHHDQEAAS